MYYLYVKKHNITKLKYLGQTTKNPEIYKGSGHYWTRHLKKHGNDVTTIVLLETEDMDELCRVSNFFSDLFDVTNSKQWANLIPETGITIDGVNETGKNIYGYNGKTPNISDNFERGRETQRWLRKNNKEWATEVSLSMSNGVKRHYEQHGSHWSGRHHRPETIEKQKKIFSETRHQSGSKNSQYGTMWITNGTINKKIKKDIDIIPEGWYKGRVLR